MREAGMDIASRSKGGVYDDNLCNINHSRNIFNCRRKFLIIYNINFITLLKIRP